MRVILFLLKSVALSVSLFYKYKLKRADGALCEQPCLLAYSKLPLTLMEVAHVHQAENHSFSSLRFLWEFCLLEYLIFFSLLWEMIFSPDISVITRQLVSSKNNKKQAMKWLGEMLVYAREGLRLSSFFKS